MMRPPMANTQHQHPASTKNANKPLSTARFMNISADDVDELEGNIHGPTRNSGTFVVNLL